MRKVAIVGARSRTDAETIRAYVATLAPDTLVISGGCRGVDTWAADAATALGLATEVFLPDLIGATHRYQIAQRFHERNARVVAACDELVAFVDGPTGGTWNTIRTARKAGKPTTILPLVPAS